MSSFRWVLAAVLLAGTAHAALAGPPPGVIRDPNLPQDAKALDFEIGRALFDRQWAAAPSSTQAADGLGPLYNARGCNICHPGGGRGAPYEPGGKVLSALLFRLGSHGKAASDAADPVYGQQIQTESVAGIAAEARATVRFEDRKVSLADGTVVDLRKPVPQLEALAYGPLAPQMVISPRLATAINGIGLLQRIPDAAILAHADPDDHDGNGISGRANHVIDAVTGKLALGRFGWKAGQAELATQDAKALDLDIGLSNPVYRDPYGDCTKREPDCLKMPNGASPQFENLEVPSSLMRLINRFVAEAVLPPSPPAADAEAGKAIFAQAGCTACHTPTYQLPADAAQPARMIAPYTDLLLHDMGLDLADHMVEGDASGREWRTAPLWGIGRSLRAPGGTGLMHDGRARSVLEAILWHDGEAAAARDRVKQLPAKDRQALIDFISSL